MISALEKEITFRFLRARKNDGFLNVISIFSFIGISLGVAVLIIVMSVMNGFRTELINKIVGFNSHITVKPYEEKILIDEKIKNKLNFVSNNLIFSNSSEAIIVNTDNSKGVILRGYLDSDFSNCFLSHSSGISFFKYSKSILSIPLKKMPNALSNLSKYFSSLTIIDLLKK